MPVEATTLTGGGVLFTNLSSANAAIAANLIDNELSAAGTHQKDLQYFRPTITSDIITDVSPASSNPFQPPQGTQLDPGITGPGTYSLTAQTGGQVLVDSTNYSDTLNIAQASPDVVYTIVGNDAGDTYNIGSNTANLVTGQGNDTVNVAGGSIDIHEGGGNVVVNASGDTSIDADGTGSVTIFLTPGSTLDLGTTDGNDTVHAFGNATVYGGTGSFVYQGEDYANSNVVAGTGNETLFGGSGSTASNLFDLTKAGSAQDMVSGGGAGASNTFDLGAGADTLVSGAGIGAASDIFNFNSTVGGGTHTITNFGAQDVINLNGYTAGEISITENAAGTTISLSDHTTIFLKGVDLSNTAIANQIKHS